MKEAWVGEIEEPRGGRWRVEVVKVRVGEEEGLVGGGGCGMVGMAKDQPVEKGRGLVEIGASKQRRGGTCRRRGRRCKDSIPMLSGL